MSYTYFITLQTLLESARRRWLLQLSTNQLMMACAIVFGGAILLLLIGTQILDWFWLAILFAASFGYGLWTILRNQPSYYQIAQLIDDRLQLHDTLSTAFHFSSSTEPVSQRVREAQARLAEDSIGEPAGQRQPGIRKPPILVEYVVPPFLR